MKNILIVCLGIILILLLLKRNSSTEQLALEEDTFAVKIQTLRDTISKVDTLLQTVIRTYEKDRKVILNWSSDSDCVFFSNYLSENSQRLFNCGDSTTIKNY